jgi:hypothetical protein
MGPNKVETVREWKERNEVEDRTNLRKYREILANMRFVIDNSTDKKFRKFAQIIIDISERE